MPVLEIKNLYQRINEQDILKNINLQVDKGEVFALIGPTGAGKTTLLRILNMLDLPTSGKIYFNGMDTAESAGKGLEIRRRTAFVLQKPVVFNMSVYDNIAVGLKWRGTEKSDIKDKTNAMLDMIGLSAYKNRNARTLSGGEMQRVAIARAIINKPEVLLLDEPSANLDPVSASKIEELLTDMIHRDNITTIMATHDMSQGQRMADRVAVLLNGEIVQTGDWRDVFNSPHNKEIASFVGVENMIDGEIVSSQDKLVSINAGENIIEAISDYPAGEKVCVCIRPEDITIATAKTSTSARNSFTGRIKSTVSFGALTRVSIDCGFPLLVLVTSRSAGELGLEKGKQVYASFKATGVHVIKRDSSI
ncbi:ABC transporter ATP-binding protein [Chloroflexota bacterium]